jgi:hypothetical protein
VVLDRLYKTLELDYSSDDAKLNDGLRLLAKWRHLLVQNTFIKNHGTTILNGPFKGVNFLSGSLEGCYVPKLLGSYEQPLHNYIEEIILNKYEVILNIGSAEGYYATGFAKRMPATSVLAFDLNSKIKDTIFKLFQKNNVTNCEYSDSIFLPHHFESYSKNKTLVFCDIEGGEKNLLDLKTAPALKNMDIVVESHDCLFKGMTEILIERFSKTHHIDIIPDNGDRQIDVLPDWFSNLAHLDQLLALWEWRSGPTPWLILKAFK